MMNMDTDHTVRIKTPYKFIWSYCTIAILIGQIISIWEPEWLSDIDVLFWIIVTLLIGMTVHSLSLLLKYYSRTYAKEIQIDVDGKTTIIYQLVRWSGVRSYDSKVLKLKVKNNILRLLKDDRTIVKIYKKSLSDHNDWDWMINYYKE